MTWRSSGVIGAWGGAWLAAVMLLVGTSRASAYDGYQNYVPNGPTMFANLGGNATVACPLLGGTRSAGNGCLLCHKSNLGGYARSCGTCPSGVPATDPSCHNNFGLAIRNGQDGVDGTADDSFWNTWLARTDSDGDGWSNGQEVGDPYGMCSFDSVNFVTTCSGGWPQARLSAPGGYTAGSLIDEPASYDMCSNGRTDCSTNSSCNDGSTTTGSYTCSCNTGYTGTGRLYTTSVFACTGSAGQSCYNIGASTGCTDINECGTPSDTCNASSMCTNTAGSFTCTACGSNAVVVGHGAGVNETCACNSGYSGSPPGTACTDINECGTASDTCNATSMCTNTAGSFTCTSCGSNAVVVGHGSGVNETCACNTGYSGSPPGTACTDVAECGTPADLCASTSMCTNTLGGYSCTPCGANAVVVGHGSGVNETCACNSGFTGSPPGTSCTDVNECGTPADLCAATSACTNTVGGYSCTACGANATVVGSGPGSNEACLCNAGYGGSPPSCTDNNECLANPCGVGGTTGGAHGNGCTNTAGSYTCACQGGYTFDGTTCTVSNPCIAGTHNCNTNATCTPLGGSSFSCACNAGWTGSGTGPTGCTNVNECGNAALNNCDAPHATCMDTAGSYVCGCAGGYSGNGITTCDDVDECANAVDPCLSGSACTNTDGSFVCTPCVANAHVAGPVSDELCTCDSGYSGNGSVSCADDDECLVVPRLCAATSACGNRNGSYTCTPCGTNAHVEAMGGVEACVCDTGYMGDGFNCSDVNECMGTAFMCDPHASCVNDVPGYHCTCKSGWKPDMADPNVCVDIDECADNTFDCDPNAHCVNDVASYHCDCNTGYEPDPNDASACLDIDECNPAPPALGPCHENATCDNVPGSHLCACDDGFTGDGLSCEDENECLIGNGGCPAGELCRNLFGSGNVCDCPPGLTRPTVGAPCISSCGNGEIVAGESCDDGNVADGDGCSHRCRIERGYACYEPPTGPSICVESCGDGLIDPPYEQCDDAAANSDVTPNACRMDCALAHCGDGVVDESEVCDDGAANSDSMPEACRTSCVPAYCGDGVTDPGRGEQCDNGHGAPLDASFCTTKRGCRRPVPVDAGVDGGAGHGNGGCATQSGTSGSYALALLLLGLAATRLRRRGAL